MKDINKKVQNVINLSASERYSYFIRKVADFEQVWGLYSDGWATLANDEEKMLAFWPEIEFAELCATDAWKDYQPKKISLEDFIEKWLNGMTRDGIKAAIFYTPAEKGVVIPAQELRGALDKELEQYE
ncbi:DUF2750 domain-containing protein [Chryseolinea soli]|uniref:DUF2750 domain-containing protein n=1 Tax=Chryseolinea soli TaxID=2321403 RepID=A0A385SWH1_9BACT|nr:DUF2750 domain-containing protein [Chryseolinea soli]AYB34305.1 DUF2750 domain-containing protein [Chryseolinea soli]